MKKKFGGENRLLEQCLTMKLCFFCFYHMGETTDLSLVEVGFLRPQTGVESQGGNETPPNGSRDSCLQKKSSTTALPWDFPLPYEVL